MIKHCSLKVRAGIVLLLVFEQRQEVPKDVPVLFADKHAVDVPQLLQDLHSCLDGTFSANRLRLAMHVRICLQCVLLPTGLHQSETIPKSSSACAISVIVSESFVNTNPSLSLAFELSIERCLP